MTAAGQRTREDAQRFLANALNGQRPADLDAHDRARLDELADLAGFADLADAQTLAADDTDTDPAALRAAHLAHVNAWLDFTGRGCDLTSITERRSDPPVFEVYGPAGVGRLTPDALTRFDRAAPRLFLAAGRWPRKPDRAPAGWWSKVAAAIVDAAEPADASAEETDLGRITAWLSDYLNEHPATDEPDDLAVHQAPYIHDGRVHIHGPGFRRWLRLGPHSTDPDDNRFGQLMRLAGAEPVTVNVRIGDRRTTRQVWRLPRGWWPR